MAPPLLRLENIKLTFGGVPLLDGAGLIVEPRDRIALVGRNGSGKSTLLKLAAGLIEADGGDRYKDPKARIAYLPQEPDLSGFASVAAYVAGDLSDTESDHEAARLIDEFGLDKEADPSTLSGGEARRAALARALVHSPDALLLDEPTNHLDIAAIELIEERLKPLATALVIVSHDRRFLQSLSNRTVWIDRGRTRNLDRGFGEFEAWRDKALEEEEAAAHRLDRKIVMEEHWVRYGVTARRKRNVRRMAELAALRERRRETRRTPGSVDFSVNLASSSGKRVIVAENISKSFAGRRVVGNFSIEIARGDRIGFVGPNGAGKTTLISLLTGALQPDEGTVTLGSALEMVMLDQRRASLDPTARVADAITDGRGDWVTIGGEKRHVASYLKDFLFGPEQWRSPVSALSGGERGRLALAAALAKPSNLLVLDEPTNDLDLETLDLLEELLADYQGTILLVSHDRNFLDRIATSVVTPERAGGGAWVEYAGGYSDMLAQRRSTSSLPKATAGKAGHAPSSATGERNSRGKLSFKEKFALEQLPGRIEALTAEIAALKAELADPALFARSHAEFAEKARRLEAAEAKLALAEDEWVNLELRRESLSET